MVKASTLFMAKISGNAVNEAKQEGVFPSAEMPYAGANVLSGWFGTHRAPEHF